ncbi:vesicle-associated membrane protein 8 [Diretmus argenteus]
MLPVACVNIVFSCLGCLCLSGLTGICVSIFLDRNRLVWVGAAGWVGLTQCDINTTVAAGQGGVAPSVELGEVEPVPQDKVQALRNQVDGVKNIMTQNVDRILARGERLDDLMGKSEDLQAGAQHFKQTSQKVARTYWWKNVKMIVVIVVIVLIIILIIILLATGVIPVGAPVPSVVMPTIKP